MAKRSTSAALNHTACPCVSARLFRFASFWRMYGRFLYSDFKYFSSRFRSFRMVLRIYAFLLLWLSAFPVLAEFTSADSSTIRDISTDVDLIRSNSNEIRSLLSNIETDGEVTHEKLNAIYRSIGITSSGDSSVIDWLDFLLRQYGYGVGSSQNGTLAQDFDTLISGQNTLVSQTDNLETLLQEIIDALENQSGSGSGSGSGTDITQDWVKQTTFQDYSDNFQTYSDNFQTYYDWMKVSLGFSEANSSPYDSPASFVEMFLTERYIQPFQYWKFNDEEAVGAAKVPFPGSPYTWVNEYPDWTTNMNSTRLALTFSQLFTYPIMTQLSEGTIQDVKLFKKAAWNDWQAHTNLVSTIVAQADRFFTPPSNDPSPTPSFDPSTGSIVTPSTGTGSADSSLSIQPSLTNDFAVIEQDINTTTNAFNFVSRSDIEDRYFSDDYLSVGSYHDYSTSSSGFSDSLNFAGIVVTLQDKFALYRKIITPETLRTVRDAFGYVWYFLAAIAAFFTVTKVAGVSVSEASE